VVSKETVAAHRAHVRATGPVWERFMHQQHGEDWWQELQQGLLRVIEALAATGASVTPCLEHITLPVLVLHGGKDPFCPPAEGQAIVASLPRARLIYDSQAGHILAWTYPMVFREIVRVFLRDTNSEERQHEY
jgi:pimeloyl-ACP methyl ester carboxylesterase